MLLRSKQRWAPLVMLVLLCYRGQGKGGFQLSWPLGLFKGSLRDVPCPNFDEFLEKLQKDGMRRGFISSLKKIIADFRYYKQ